MDKYIKAGHTYFLVEAVKGKSLKKLKEQHPDKDERILKQLIVKLKAKK